MLLTVLAFPYSDQEAKIELVYWLYDKFYVMPW